MIAALAAAYLLQVFTPLRLHPDTVVLLSVAESAARSGHYLFEGRETVFPPGYPTAVSLLRRLGLCRNSVLIGLNLLFLALGFRAVSRLMASSLRFSALSCSMVCIVSMLSFVLVKHVAIALTDIWFFGIAMSSLAVMQAAAIPTPGRRFLWLILAAWSLVVLAITVRRIGVALIPPLISLVVFRPGLIEAVRRWPVQIKTACVLLACGLGVLTCFVVAGTSTLQDLRTAMAGQAIGETATRVARFRLVELGEMTVNVPRSSLSPGFQSALPFLGAVTFALVLAGLWRRRHVPGPSEVFLCCYIAILFVWPFDDPRFWLPVIPLLAGYSALGMGGVFHRRRWRLACAAPLGVYAFMGAITIAASTAVTFSGSNFPNAYPDGIYRATYCAAYQSCDNAASAAPVDEAALRLLFLYK